MKISIRRPGRARRAPLAASRAGPVTAGNPSERRRASHRPRPDVAARVAFVAAVAAATALALWCRSRGLDAASLCVDDEWVGIVVRKMSLAQFFTFRPPVPVGFVLVEKLAVLLSSGLDRPLQLFPLVCSVVQVPLVALVASAVTGRKAFGVLAAVLVVVAPAQIELGVRVKQFATDAAITLALLAVGADLLERWTTRRAALVAATAAAAVLLSFPSVFVSFPLLHLALARALARPSERKDRRARGAVALTLGFDAFLAVVYVALLRAQGGAAMTEYWAPNFLPLDPKGALAFLTDQGWGALQGVLPPVLAAALLLMPLGLVGLWLQPGRRGLAVLLAAFYVEFAAASALRLYPLGGGRTDCFAHPVAILLVVAGLELTTRWIPGRRTAATAACCGAVLLALSFAEPSHYPSSGDADVIRKAEETVRLGDALIINPHGALGVGYYGHWPIRIVPWPEYAHGFHVVVERPDTLTLPPRPRYWETPATLAPELDAFLSRPRARIFLLAASWVRTASHQFIVTRLAEHGYAMEVVIDDKSAALLRFAPKRS